MWFLAISKYVEQSDSHPRQRLLGEAGAAPRDLAPLARRTSSEAPRRRRRWPLVVSAVVAGTGVLVGALAIGDGRPPEVFTETEPAERAALNYVDGVLEANGARYAVGQAGDRVALGDWSCDGRVTLVLLRPSTGRLYRFDGWADAAADAPAQSIGEVSGATSVRRGHADHDGCDELVVDRSNGPPVTVAVRP